MTSQDFIQPYNESISVEDCRKLAGLDYGALVKEGSLTLDAFVESNVLGYYVFCNTWILVVKDLAGERVGNLLKSSMRTLGIVPTIVAAQKLSDGLVQAANQATSLEAISAVRVDASLTDHELYAMKEWLTRTSRLPFRLARQLCNFAKRFTPVVQKHNSALHDDAIAAFREVNHCNVRTEFRLNSLASKMMAAECSRKRLLPYMSEEIPAYMVDVAVRAQSIIGKIVGEFEGLSSQDFPRVGPGACRNAGKSVLERFSKIVQYGDYVPGFMPTWRRSGGILRTPHPDTVPRYRRRRRERKMVELPPLLPRGFWGRSPFPQVCRVTTVPKTYKKARLIALEDVCNMSRQLFIKDKLTKRIARTGHSTVLPIGDQEKNRELARIAAETNKLATLDLSHASDSVTKPLVRLLFPQSWWDYGFECCVPYGYILDEAQERPTGLHMFATMGCGCTFIVEALVFYSLVAATIWIEQESDGRQIPYPLRYLNENVRVMGDDIILPTEFAGRVISVLAFFGFEVNNDKSFLEGRFRESCGADWIRTDDEGVVSATCFYWPRIPIGGDAIETLQRSHSRWDSDRGERYWTCGLLRLIALQHTLFDHAPSASEFLADLILGYFPQISTSFPGLCDTTVWSNNPVASYLYYCPEAFGGELLRQQRSGNLLVRHCEAVRALAPQNPWIGRSGSFARLAEAAWFRHQLALRRRRAFVVPTMTVDKHVTGLYPGAAEILLYELKLRQADAAADGVLDITVVCNDPMIAEQARHHALDCMRPSLLTTAQLAGEVYTLTFKIIY